MNIRIDHITKEDGDWIRATLCDRWGDVRIVTRGNVYRGDDLPGLIAWREGEPVGLLTYRLQGNECQIVTLDALIEGEGIGTALVDALREEGVASGWDRLWLVTTNDNRHAQNFWGRRGFRLTAIHAGAIEEARRLKPSIPKRGYGGIPILDELEYEFVFSDYE